MKRAKIVQKGSKMSFANILDTIRKEVVDRYIFKIQSQKKPNVTRLNTAQFEKDLAENIFLK